MFKVEVDITQECIPVGCTPTAAAAILGGSSLLPQTRHPPLDQTPTPRPDPSKKETPLPVDRRTHAYENITLPASLRYAVGKNG